MAKHYDIAMNWATSRESVFTTTLLAAAQRRGVRARIVLPTDASRIRKLIMTRSLSIGVFLNTQADGTDMECPKMRLCRAVKAAGALVIEDPDDAHVYADRALQLEYLERAGLCVPRHLVLEDWHPRKSRLTEAQKAVVGTSWTARPARGLAARNELIGKGPCSAATLGRGPFVNGEKLLILRRPAERRHTGRRLFRVWYLFGEIIACRIEDDLTLTPQSTADAAGEHLRGLLGMARRIHDITGLDWFATELAASSRTEGPPQWSVSEPANALAGFGPGVRALAHVPDVVAATAARRLVDVTWRRQHQRNPCRGTTLRMA